MNADDLILRFPEGSRRSLDRSAVKSADLRHSTGTSAPTDADAPATTTRLADRLPAVRRRYRLAAVAGVAVLLGAGIWALAGSNPGGSPATAAGGSRLVRGNEVAALGLMAGHPVFWAGARKGAQLEYSDDGTGNVQVRYLETAGQLGTAAGSFLSIGTYPFNGAYRATRVLARSSDLREIPILRGTGFIDPSRPYSVILAWAAHPDLQVEVYDPVRYRALRIVRAGDIVPVP